MSKSDDHLEVVRQSARSLPGVRDVDTCLYIDSDQQRLEYWRAGVLDRYYPISTARNGLGCQQNSYCTPQGLHRISEKIGGSAQSGEIFIGRENTGKLAAIESAPVDTGLDQITSRILWLTGLEPGVNQGGDVDSHARYIYIHGTNEEGRLGVAASHGCVRMANTDVIELYDRVEVDTLVYIA